MWRNGNTAVAVQGLGVRAGMVLLQSSSMQASSKQGVAASVIIAELAMVGVAAKLVSQKSQQRQQQ